LALHELKKNGRYEVIGLLTTVTEGYERISMHGVRSGLLAKQAENLGMPLERVYIPKESSNEKYETAMKEALLRYKDKGVSAIAFGDLFLEDLKHYREHRLAEVGLKAVFPLWKRDTKDLSHEFIRLGFKAVITCVDSQVLDGRFSGREFDEQFLSDLPGHIDPCGENGEFHSFVYDGPIFNFPVRFKKGGVVIRDNRFHFCELIEI
ncbi:MAG: hypothetical protein WAV13_04090, partial [Thermodesulfovibrionales bacterium]